MYQKGGRVHGSMDMVYSSIELLVLIVVGEESGSLESIDSGLEFENATRDVESVRAWVRFKAPSSFLDVLSVTDEG